MMSNAFEAAFDAFLKRREYDEAKGRPLYTVLRTINFDVQK